MYSRARCIKVRDWAGSVNQQRITNARSKWVGDSTWRNQVRIAIAGSNSRVIKAQMDVKKAFENVNRRQLVDIAKKVGHPEPELLTSSMAYFWEIHIVYDGVASEAIPPRSGIAASSAGATFELTVLLMPALEKMAQVDPEACVSLHVDDIWVAIIDRSRSRALARFENILAVINGEFA